MASESALSWSFLYLCHSLTPSFLLIQVMVGSVLRSIYSTRLQPSGMLPAALAISAESLVAKEARLFSAAAYTMMVRSASGIGLGISSLRSWHDWQSNVHIYIMSNAILFMPAKIRRNSNLQGQIDGFEGRKVPF